MCVFTIVCFSVYARIWLYVCEHCMHGIERYVHSMRCVYKYEGVYIRVQVYLRVLISFPGLVNLNECVWMCACVVRVM